nr:rhodanese-like domain-containing protein [Leptospira kmetyi]
MDSFFDPDRELNEFVYKDFLKQVISKDVILVDVRPEYEYNSGHVPGSISIPLGDLKVKLDRLPKRKKIVAYCRGKFCVLSKRAVEILRKKGLYAYRIGAGPLEFLNYGIRLTN